MDDRLYRLLRIIAVAMILAWVAWAIYDRVRVAEPGDDSYLAANTLFEDGFYERALTTYRDTLAEAPDHLPALRGMANSLIQLDRHEDALITIARAIQLDPVFPGHYATRGIIHDHLGRFDLAMTDYRRALEQDPELAEGMHWLDRLLHNVPETPPTIADRLAYLRDQMALPPEERLLRVPEIDANQRPIEK